MVCYSPGGMEVLALKVALTVMLSASSEMRNIGIMCVRVCVRACARVPVPVAALANASCRGSRHSDCRRGQFIAGTGCDRQPLPQSWGNGK